MDNVKTSELPSCQAIEAMATILWLLQSYLYSVSFKRGMLCNNFEMLVRANQLQTVFQALSFMTSSLTLWDVLPFPERKKSTQQFSSCVKARDMLQKMSFPVDFHFSLWFNMPFVMTQYFRY
jgi:hypothetical protein